MPRLAQNARARSGRRDEAGGTAARISSGRRGPFRRRSSPAIVHNAHAASGKDHDRVAAVRDAHESESEREVSSTQKLALPPNRSRARRRTASASRIVSGRAKAASARTASRFVSVVSCPSNAT